MSDTSAPILTNQIEERFLDALKEKDHPIENLLNMLQILNDCTQLQRRDDCSNVLQESFIERQDFNGLIKLLKMRASWLGNNISYSAECRDVLCMATKDRLMLSMVDSVAFNKNRPLDSLKRLETLTSLKPASACSDKTWGYGIIRNLDDFYKRIIVDFDRKHGHEMSFAYAAEALRPIDENNILAVQHNNPNEFAEKCGKNAGEVVLMAVKSFGPMTVTKMEAELTKGFLPPNVTWKSFWSQARTQLKNNPHIKLPPATNKTELIRMEEVLKQTGDEGWFTELSKLNDVEKLLARIETFNGLKAKEISESERAILNDRFSFILKACATTHNNKDKIRAIMLAVSLGFKKIQIALRGKNNESFAMDDENTVDLEATICVPDIIINAAPKLSFGQLDSVVSMIPLAENHAVAKLFAEKITHMPYGLLERMANLLMTGVAAHDFEKTVKHEFSNTRVSLPLILWLCRNHDSEYVGKIISNSIIATQALVSFDFQEMGENLRLQHQIARCFTNKVWLDSLAKKMTLVELRSFFERVQAVDEVWTPAEKRAIISSLLKTYPELTVPAEFSADVATVPTVQRITSWRSLNERREKYRVLIEEEIPQNAKDIEVARSYGDLRENFEYQTAKDQQRILMQRQADMEQDISSMKGSDFSGIVPEKVGVGSCVTILFDDGHGATYHILGEWDNDLALGIIPSRGELAKCLEGHVIGDKVEIPTEVDNITAIVLISSIQPLSRTILEWAMGR